MPERPLTRKRKKGHPVTLRKEPAKWLERGDLRGHLLQMAVRESPSREVILTFPLQLLNAQAPQKVMVRKPTPACRNLGIKAEREIQGN